MTTHDVHTTVLSALCDGEVVEPAALAAALEDPAARQALVDFARLRQAVALDRSPLPGSLRTLRGHRPWLLRASVPLPAVAALVLVALLAALSIARPGDPRQPEAPPTPSRVISYVPGVDWHTVDRR